MIKVTSLKAQSNLMKRLIVLLPVVLLFVNACKQEACNNEFAFNYDPDGTSEENCIWEPMQFDIEFNVNYGGEEVELGKELITEDGRSLTFDYFGVYLSEISVYEGENKITLENDVMLLLDSNRVFSTIYTPSNTIDSLTFNVGVNEDRNDTLDPTTLSEGPLAPQNPNMYWGWATGYIFTSMSGVVDTTMAADGSAKSGFQYHTGGNDLLRTVTIESTPSRRGNTLVYQLNLDLKKVLEGVDFTTELSTHTFDNMPLAIKVTENYKNAFEAE